MGEEGSKRGEDFDVCIRWFHPCLIAIPSMQEFRGVLYV